MTANDNTYHELRDWKDATVTFRLLAGHLRVGTVKEVDADGDAIWLLVEYLTFDAGGRMSPATKWLTHDDCKLIKKRADENPNPPMGGGNPDAPIMLRPMDKYVAQRLAEYDEWLEARLAYSLNLLPTPPPAPKLAWTCACGYQHSTTYLLNSLAECGCGRRHEWHSIADDKAAYEAARCAYIAWLTAGNSIYIKYGA